jgi:hypothetical protein
VFEYISSLRPYFHSLREIKGNISLDIKLPLNWNYEEIIKPYSSIQVITQDKNDSFTLLSVISAANKEGYKVVYACVSEIIKINQEEEEKERLFQEKVKELQELFKNKSLDKLKEINLSIIDEKQIDARDGMASQRDGERPEGSGEPQVKNDKRNKSDRQTRNIKSPTEPEKTIQTITLE